MRITELWKTSFKSILKNKRRSFLTMIGLVIGVSSVILVFSIGRGFERYAADYLELDSYEAKLLFNFEPADTSIYNTNLEFFSPDDIKRIEGIDGVISVAYSDSTFKGVTYYSQQIDEAKQASNKGYFKLLTEDGSDDIIYGRKISESDNINENKVVVINEEIAKTIKKENPESLIGKSTSIQGQLFEIVGIMKDREQSGIFMSPENFVTVEVPKTSYMNYFKSEKYSIDVQLEESARPDVVKKNIEDSLDKYGSLKDMGNYSGEDPAAQITQIRVILAGITALVSFIGGISLFISGIGVMNMIYISVSERTKEIGVRRAMGATRNNVMLQFLLEGITLTLIGGVIGYLWGMFLGLLISMVTPFTVIPDFSTAILALILSIVIGIVFSWLPATSASKKDIVTLLR